MQHKKTPATKKNTAKAHKTQQKLNETQRKYKKKILQKTPTMEVFLGNSFRRDRNQSMRRIALRLKRSRGFFCAVREKKMQAMCVLITWVM